jgi:hypothetical protein
MQSRVIKSAKRRSTGSQENVSTNFTLTNDSIYTHTSFFQDGDTYCLHTFFVTYHSKTFICILNCNTYFKPRNF